MGGSGGMTTTPRSGGTARKVREVPVPDAPLLEHPVWAARYPWLIQGTTWRGATREPFDLGLFSGGSAPERVQRRWLELSRWAKCGVVIHARQEHGSTVRVHSESLAEAAPHLVESCDGHVTGESGVLLTVAVADCVPVSIVDPESRCVGAVHAGWRGAAAGVLEEGLRRVEAVGGRVDRMLVHMGPSICGSCYEVGPEVFQALGQGTPDAPAPIDLRAILAERAVDHGVTPANVTISEHCTRCTGSGLFSHRGGDRGRQVGVLGVRGSE